MSFISADQLATVAAVADSGSFDRAGQRLNVTTSAISQRVKALERALGQVLIRRGTPCRLTPAGTVVLRHARQAALLEAELRAELAAADGTSGGPAGGVELPVAVNADSLATWFPAVFDQAAAWPGVRLALHVEDEEHTAGLLRDGVVLGAVSADPAPVHGCRRQALTTMTYRPYARADLLAAATGRHGADLRTLPPVRYDAKDDLQDRALRAAGVTEAVPGPRIPNSQAFVAAVLAGLGWGMLPAAQLPAGHGLVEVPGLAPVVRRLYWHRWKLDSAWLDRLTDAVVAAARTADRDPADPADPASHQQPRTQRPGTPSPARASKG